MTTPPTDPQARRTVDLGAALVRIGTVVALAVAPIAVLTTMFVVSLASGPLSGDFHFELYPESKQLLHGENPFPPLDWDPTAKSNLIWPPFAAYLVSPLTLLPQGAADVVIVLIGLACFALSLWLVGVRDWRVYGVVGLWPEVVSEMRVSHLTPIVCVLVAAAWRYRDVRAAPGLAVGAAVAVKFFVWPVGLWLAAVRRTREAVIAALVAGASLLLVVPFIGVNEYARLLARLGRAFDQDSYTPYGLLVQAGVTDTVARAVTLAVGAAVLGAMWRYRSFALAVAAALILSPIVWLDYFALAALPLALARPRLSAIWFLPLATWGLEGAGVSIGDVSDIARLLIVFAVVFAVACSRDLGSSPTPTGDAVPTRMPPAARPVSRSSET